jgi:hypothetical protein
MGRVSLCYDRTARRKGGRGVAPRDGERECKVACTKYRNWSNRAIHGAHVRLWNRFPIGNRILHAGINPCSFPYDASEHAQLIARAIKLTIGTTLGKASFSLIALNDIGASALKLNCNLI